MPDRKDWWKVFARLIGNMGLADAFRRSRADDLRGSPPPPIPIVTDEAQVMELLKREYGMVVRGEADCCLALVRCDDLQESDADAAVVAAIAERYSRNLRPYDGLCCFGSDMHLIVLSHIKVEDAEPVLQRLRGVIDDKLLSLPDGDHRAVTVSIGGAMVDADLSIEENLDRVGRALYAAKSGGGNRACLRSE